MTGQMQPNKAKPVWGRGGTVPRSALGPRYRFLPPFHPFSENGSK